MKKLFGTWMLCALAMLIGSPLLSACSDSNDSEGGNNTPEQPAYISELQEQLTGSWNADGDGVDDLDLVHVNTIFGKDNTMDIEVLSYDIDNELIDSANISMTYQLLAPSNGTATGRAFLISTPTAEGIEELTAMMDEQLADSGEIYELTRDEILEEVTSPDTTLVWIENDSLYMFRAGDSLVDTLENYNKDIRALLTAKLARGRKTITMAEINEQRDKLNLYKNISEWVASRKGEDIEDSFADFNMEDFMNGDYTPSAARRANKPEDIYGHNNRLLRTWMSQVKDDMKVRDMMIPGSHDTATFGMWLPYMWTFARTQECDISEQWDRGIRCFDLRTRFSFLYNYMFHDFISCKITLDEIFRQVLEKVKENPSEGAVLMITTEGNMAGFKNMISDFLLRQFVLNVFPGINLTAPDPVVTMNITGDLVADYFYDNGVLAKFSPDMTMKDLRGKVLVFLMNAPSAQADDMDYPEEILDYIANWKDDHITDMYGKRIAEVKEQNLWEQKQDESESDYIYRKTNQFRETMQWCIDNKDSNYWVYNAANGYYWDPWGGLKVIPDYATYAQDAYPTFANDIAEMGDARGIVLMDYVGMTEFKRVSANLLLSSFAIFGFVPGIVAALATWTEAVSASNLILFYYTCKMFSKWKYLRTQELINNIVEVNIPSELNTNITDTPTDYARTPDRTVDNAWQ